MTLISQIQVENTVAQVPGSNPAWGHYTRPAINMFYVYVVLTLTDVCYKYEQGQMQGLVPEMNDKK